MTVTAQFVKNLKRFRLVTFDVTDTLLQLKDPVTQYSKTASEYGITNLDTTRMKKCFRKQFKWMDSTYPNFGRDTPNMTWQDWWIQLVGDVFHCVDANIPNEQLASIAQKLLFDYRTRDCWSHIECGMEFVENVRQAGKYVGVISNFDPSLITVLREMGLSDKFDFVLTSYEAGIQKPHADIFKIPLKQMEVDATQALHIGNKYSVDYIGARSTGWSSLLVQPQCGASTGISGGQPEAGINPTHVYTSLAEMLRALKTQRIEW